MLVCCRPVCTPKRTSMGVRAPPSDVPSDVRHDFGGDQPQVVEVVEVEHLEVHGLGALLPRTR